MKYKPASCILVTKAPVISKMVKLSLSALLDASERSDVLDKPVEAGVSNADAWPHKEHDSLKGAMAEEDFFTDLMVVIQMNQVDLKTEISRIPERKREIFKQKHQNALTFKIDGTTTNKASLYNFDQRLKRLKILVVQHVQDCIRATTSTYREKSLFASEQASSGAVSQDANLRATRRLHTIVSPLLANNLLQPGPNETAEINSIILKENNLNQPAM